MNNTQHPNQFPKLHPLEFNLLTTVKNNLENNSIILLNISGGLDSMCLLNAFNNIVKARIWPSNMHIKLVILHFNHEQRGLESDLDEALVVETAAKMQIPCIVEKWSQSKLNSSQENFQNTARLWRKSSAQNIISLLLTKYNMQHAYITTAHHNRDLVESILLHVVRGSGLSGVQGFPILDNSNLYFKPFAHTKYADLQTYYSSCQSFSYRTDASNLQTTYERNFIRLKILPLLAELNPAYEKAFLHLSENCAEAFTKLQKLEHWPLELPIEKATTSGEIWRYATVRHAELREILTFEHLQNIIAHANRKSSKGKTEINLELGDNWVAILKAGTLSFRKKADYHSC